MSFENLLTAILEDTTSANIAFIPGSFGGLSDAINSLAKLKKQWNLEVIDKGDTYDADFEKKLVVNIKKPHWDEFTQKVLKVEGMKPVSGTVDLTSCVNCSLKRESKKHINEEISRELRDELRDAIIFLIENDSVILRSISEIEAWKTVFPGSKYSTPLVQIGYNNIVKDIDTLVKKIIRFYDEDESVIRVLIPKIRAKKIDVLFLKNRKGGFFGASLSVNYMGYQLIFNTDVDFNFSHYSRIYSPDADVLDIVRGIRSVEVITNAIMPYYDRFNVKIFEEIRDAIKDSEI